MRNTLEEYLKERDISWVLADVSPSINFRPNVAETSKEILAFPSSILSISEYSKLNLVRV